jgi:two-component system NtrC family sensor kinase
MKKRSFRTVITVTLVVVISSISFTAFHIYSHLLENKIHEEAERNNTSALAALTILKDQFYYSIDEHDGSIIETLLLRMDNKDQVVNSFLFDDNNKFRFSLYKDTSDINSIIDKELITSRKGISIESFPLEAKPFTRAYINMENAPSCYECHSKNKEHLGYIVIDLSMTESESNKAFIIRSSLIFTLSMVIIIIIFIIFIHYRFVRKSLRDFNSTINSVNQGNLGTRLSIPETKELGQLGKSFNSMLSTFQMAQKELEDFHKKELRSNYRLATIGEMSARLAHEIRNPITGIANAIEIIVKESRDDENLPILEEVQRQAKRVNDAISDLLKFSRKRDLNIEINEINDLIKSMVFFLENQVYTKEIKFILDLQEDIPAFRFDREQLENVLLNLGLNAIQAIPQNGSVSFSTNQNQENDQIGIIVSDTGKGIPKENISSIFHPFYTTRSEGTGLGLAIVKDTIDKHKGEIFVENNEKDGCTFTILLPFETE